MRRGLASSDDANSFFIVRQRVGMNDDEDRRRADKPNRMPTCEYSFAEMSSGLAGTTSPRPIAQLSSFKSSSLTRSMSRFIEMSPDPENPRSRNT